MNQSIDIQKLYKAIKEDNQLAFANLYDLLGKKLFRRAYAILKDKDKAQDIVQDIWIDFWQKRHKTDIENVENYLMRSVRFAVYKHLRDNKITLEQEKILENLPTLSEIENLYDLKALEKKLDEILNDLSPRIAEIFRMSKIKGLNNEEIAKALGISKRTVDNQLSKATKHVKGNLNTVLFLIAMLSLKN